MSKRLSVFKKGPSAINGKSNDPPTMDAPPAYKATSDSGLDANGINAPPTATAPAPTPAPANGAAAPPNQADISAAFASLTLTDSAADPDPDTCLAHLKLLFAIQSLKDDVGYTDGLWGLWDSRAADATARAAAAAETTKDPRAANPARDESVAILSQLREKRWALFLARAVDRYQAWWMALPGKRMLRVGDMDQPTDVPAYTGFVKGDAPKPYFNATNLPPLDVLMVLHAHMLNPRSFLEDCMRYGHHALWTAGMPWNLVNAAIDDKFDYTVDPETRARWTADTGRAWDNADDPIVKNLKCPACQTALEIPWTTVGRSETAKSNGGKLDLIGSGYGDGQLKWICNCGITIDKELLSVAKFCDDAKNLLHKTYPMPGTLLELRKGQPELPRDSEILRNQHPRTFPNRMIQKCLRSQLVGLVRPPSSLPPQSRLTMNFVKTLIEGVLADADKRREIDGLPKNARGQLARHRTPAESKVQVRKMMSRYWENFSPFALDLVGAVMRQGIFVEKMYRIDWLHSPAAAATMERLIRKYNRFIDIMARNPRSTAVPTLDVDLAWHTHQLSPRAYYDFTVRKAGKFIDHDDKMDEDKLSQAFEWTSKTYQDTYGEVYSECTCWYCETVRAGHASSVGRLLGASKQDKIADAFYSSGAAKLCPPDNSAHISAHNAVKARVSQHAHQIFEARLDAQYEKAVRRAEKKGRKLPPREQYYDHWGYSYYMYGPWIYPLYFYPGMYYAWAPGYVGGVDGTGAACAAGSCGNNAIAAGACGGPGGCGGCGSAGATATACAGGACGGGGGGGCGGGGGGGGCGGCGGS